MLRRIAAIGSLPEQLNSVVVRATRLVDDISAVRERWLGALTLIRIVLLIWVAATYVALVYRWLSSGWRMLQGLPAG
ncbi:MAG: hypothetical protein ACRDGG_09845 [Anaerolineae bacterium]